MTNTKVYILVILITFMRKTGRAYAYLNYEGRWTELAGDLRSSKERANFPDTFRIMVIDDKISTTDMEGRVLEMYRPLG